MNKENLDNAYRVCSSWKGETDLTKDNITLFMHYLRHFYDDNRELRRPECLASYMNWFEHRILDTAQHSRILGDLGRRLDILHGEFGYEINHPSYGEKFATFVLRLNDIRDEIYYTFKNYDLNRPFFNGNLHWYFSVAMLLALSEKELVSGERIFRPNGSLHKSNLKKYYFGVTRYFPIYLSYYCKDNTDARYPRILVAHFAVIEMDNLEYAEIIVNVAALDEHDRPISNKFILPLPRNSNGMIIPKKGLDIGDFRTGQLTCRFGG